MTSYLVAPAAVVDLDSAAAYLADQAGVELARRFLDAAATSFAAIARMPGLGELWATTDPRLAGLRVRRADGFTSHLVFYRPTDAGVVIVRVLGAARDLDAALAGAG